MDLIGSSLAGHSMYVYDGSEFNLKNGQIELKEYGDGLEVYRSRVTLEEVDITVNRDRGLLIMGDSDFNMIGGGIQGSAQDSIVEVYGDPNSWPPKSTRATFKALPGQYYISYIQNTKDNATTLLVGEKAVVSLEDYNVESTGQRGVALDVWREEAKVDMKGVSGYAPQLSSSSDDGVALRILQATDADVSFDSMNVYGGDAAILVMGNSGDNKVAVSSSAIRGGNALVRIANEAVVSGTKLHLRADGTTLRGKVDVANGGPRDVVTMELLGSSTWELSSFSGSPSGRSDLARLDIQDSSVYLAEPDSLTTYNTLVIGDGHSQSGVYNASGDSYLHFRTRLNEGGRLSNQFTDRLLVNGDVNGQTKVQVDGESGSVSADTGRGADKGISIVQVSGSAQEDSFILSNTGGYVAVNGQPWQYKLYAYGPGASEGLADNDQRLVDGSNPHWDYRLQNEYVTPPPVTPPPVTPPPVTPPPVTPPPAPVTGGIRAVAPQVYSYLVAPNALFQAGLSNIRNLHRHLAETRVRDAGADDNPARNGAFLHVYGEDWDYRTNLGAANYGVDADVRHSAAQGGFNLATLDNDSGVMQIGLSSSIGDVDFTPHDVNGARKTKLDQWTISPYLSWQSAGGAYVDATISQGGFKGNVSTGQRGRTARLKGDNQVLSLESGFPFALGKVVLEPQVQLVWQRLEFDKASDVDGFQVHLGTMTQSTARAGAKMSFGGSAVRMYGSAHFSHTSSNEQQAWLGNTFLVGRMGNALETSLGFDSSLGRRRVSLYGDIGHQTRIGGAGHQGWGANIGVKAKF